ncbi:hypothetical protein [Kitasatospora sp. NPDC085879]|uniref:hypothetical protein n=1 Tax=Kitasatospora sp. NPDC085879 TaxID=3154769 RepID=UPI00342388BD
MRKISLPAPVLAAAFGCLVLAGCAPQPGAGHTLAGSFDSASNPADALSNSGDPEMRFLALVTRVTQKCAPNAPSDKGGGVVPRPGDLAAAGEEVTPRYGPGQTPPGTPNADGDIPVPLPPDAPEPSGPASAPAGPEPVGEVPLVGVDECAAREHAERIREAFTNSRAAGFEAMRDRLAGLDYPASRIHRMPDRAGAPRVRIDLRFMGNNLALEVTGTGSGVTVEPFGASEREDVQVTDVKRTPASDTPTP